MPETTGARPADALNEQDLEAVNAGLSIPGFIANIAGAVTGGVTPGIVMSVAERLAVPSGLTGGIGPGPAASPLSIQGGCPVQLSSHTG